MARGVIDALSEPRHTDACMALTALMAEMALMAKGCKSIRLDGLVAACPLIVTLRGACGQTPRFAGQEVNLRTEDQQVKREQCKENV
eukprot:scaffold66624_cov19-Tisochrysis_lutea.AAC.1